MKNIYLNNDTEKLFLKSQLLDFTRRNLKPSKGKNLFVCPFCHSGEGPHKTGAFSINTKENYYKCFSCNETGDIFNLYEFLHNCDFSQTIRELKELYNLTSSNFYTENLKQNSNFSIYNKNTQQTNYKREEKKDSHEPNLRLKELLKRQEEFLRADREKQEQRISQEERQEEQKQKRTQELIKDKQNLEEIKEAINFIKEKYKKICFTQKDINKFLFNLYSLDFHFNEVVLDFLSNNEETQEGKETAKQTEEICKIKEEINFFYEELNKKDSKNLRLYILLYKFFSQEETFFIYENDFFRITVKEEETQSQEQNQESQKNYFFIYKEDKTSKNKEEYKLNKNDLKTFLFSQDWTEEVNKINNILKSIFILSNKEKWECLEYLEKLANQIKEKNKINFKKELNFIYFFTYKDEQQKEQTPEEDRKNYIFILSIILAKLQKKTKEVYQNSLPASYKKQNTLNFLYFTIIKEILFYS